MEELLEISERLISEATNSFRRSLYDAIHWHERLIGIKGARGVGKTTMLLQWLHEQKRPTREAAYFSLDELYFTTHRLVDTAREFFQQGGQLLVLDEVHKYPGWAREIKNIYDRYAALQVVFTGSSIINISQQEADLSRRVRMYELPGLSYREYLALYHQQTLPVLTLPEILSAESLRTQFPKDFRPLAHFKDYLVQGYYPFYQEYQQSYQDRLRQLVRAIVEYDMAELKGFDIRHAKKMLQLLYVIAQEVPFKPNINSLSDKTKLHRATIGNYLYFLHDARLLHLLFASGSGVSTLQKPEKVYLHNTNLLYALSETPPEIGTVREVFFGNQLSALHAVAYSAQTDFVVDQQYHFEVGGSNKGRKQIKGLTKAWVVKDDLEYPVGQSLPLWAFGFLY
ncbi:MAG: AAA family ATPase [Tunicatimonas sp.]